MNARVALALRRRRSEEPDEGYFVTMSDMLVGLLFVFIIMLVYFALQLKQTTAKLTDAQATRAELLTAIDVRLQADGLSGGLDYENGLLRLPDDVLFDKGSAVLTERGRVMLTRVASTLGEVLPCHTYGPTACDRRGDTVESVQIEGHTDADPMNGAVDNWDLSAQRATNTYRALVAARPELAAARNAPAGDPAAEPVLGVAGYGPTRPVAAETSEAGKRRNRRIDIRFVMARPGATPPAL